jgi:hypothetical protein
MTPFGIWAPLSRKNEKVGPNAVSTKERISAVELLPKLNSWINTMSGSVPWKIRVPFPGS